MPTAYLIQAFDVRHNWLDVDPRGEGYPSYVTGPGEMLAFIRHTKHGILHNFDTETHTRKPIAYWVVCDDRGTPREIYTTTAERQYKVQPQPQGPGCREPRPIPI